MNSEIKFRVPVGDDRGTKNLRLMCFFDGQIVALVTQEGPLDQFEIEIFPCLDADRSMHDFNDFYQAVAVAKKILAAWGQGICS